MKTVRNTVLVFTLIFFSLGQIGRIGIGDYPVFIHLYEVPLVLFTILLMFKFRLKPLSQSKLKILWIMAIWTLISFIISLFFYSWYENVIALMYMLRLAFHLLFGMYVSTYILQLSVTHLNTLKLVMYALIAWFAGTMIVQYFLYPNIGNIAYLGWDPHIQRAVGLFLEPPLAAAFLGLSMIYLYQSKFLIIYRYTSIGILGMLFLLTYSRGALVAGLSTLGYLLLRSMKLQLLSTIIVIMLFGLVLSGKSNLESTNLFRTSSIQSRMTDYQQGVEIWSQNIISGIGYNHIRFEKETYIDEVFVEDYNPSHGISSFHSSFLIVGVTTGVIGLAIAFIGLVQLWSVNMFTKLAVIFLSIISLFDNVFLHPFILVLFALMLVLNHSSRISPSSQA